MRESVELANECIRLAQQDYDLTLLSNASMNPKPLERICNLCQQVVERLLKSLIYIRGQEPPKTHDLDYLMGIVESLNPKMEFSSDVRYAAGLLSQYSVRVRYPFEIEIEENDELSSLDYTKAICKDINIKLESLKNKELSLLVIAD